MGKKKEKIEIRLSDEELVPSTIGILEDQKNSSVGLIVLFLIFILFAIFLPNITEGINKLLGKDDDIVVTPPKENETDNKKEDDKENIEIYDLVDNLEITYNNIKFSGFTKYELNGKYYLLVKIENLSENIVNFEKNKYYLETYSQDKTLLKRHVFNNAKIDLKSNISQTLEISFEEYSSISKIVISEKTIKDYPKISLELNDNKQYTLTCITGVNNITYTFDKNEKLIRIKDTVNMSNDGSTTYSQSLSFYQTQAANLNNKEGISSSLVEVSTGFTTTTDIDLISADIKSINNDNYYSKAEPKVIDFEMESRGYSCN